MSRDSLTIALLVSITAAVGCNVTEVEVVPPFQLFVDDRSVQKTGTVVDRDDDGNDALQCDTDNSEWRLEGEGGLRGEGYARFLGGRTVFYQDPSGTTASSIDTITADRVANYWDAESFLAFELPAGSVSRIYWWEGNMDGFRVEHSFTYRGCRTPDCRSPTEGTVTIALICRP